MEDAAVAVFVEGGQWASTPRIRHVLDSFLKCVDTDYGNDNLQAEGCPMFDTTNQAVGDHGVEDQVSTNPVETEEAVAVTHRVVNDLNNLRVFQERETKLMYCNTSLIYNVHTSETVWIFASPLFHNRSNARIRTSPSLRISTPPGIVENLHSPACPR